jgi:predicted HicB family RNase H-like nuclease
MKDTLIYRDYIGSVHFAAEDEVFYGKIEGIDDLVTFEGETVSGLKESFKEAVDDYLDLCKQTGKEPETTSKGSFNVRLNPSLHHEVKRQALLQGISLNQFIQKAVEHELART